MKPAAASTPNVPSSTTGTAIVGISVARKFCRNRYITRNTSTIASSSVLHHSPRSTASRTASCRRDRRPPARREVRLELGDARPDGLGGVQRVGAGRQLMPMPGGGLAVVARDRCCSSRRRARCARRRAGAPASRRCCTFSRMLPNSSGVCRRDCAGDRGVELLAGRRRSAAELAGRDLRVLRRDGVRRRRPASARSCSACSGRARCASRTACRTRDGADAVDAADRVLHVGDDVVGDVVSAPCCRRWRRSPRPSGRCRCDLVTRTPCCCTSCGSSGMASCSLFCTCTCAMSGLVPGSKVSVIVRRAGAVAGGRHVQQVVDAVHLLLDHLDHRVLRPSARKRRDRSR